VFECTAACNSAKYLFTSASTFAHTKRSGKSSAKGKSSRAEAAEAEHEEQFQEQCFRGINFCQHGVSVKLRLAGFADGKGFGVITDEVWVSDLF